MNWKRLINCIIVTVIEIQKLNDYIDELTTLLKENNIDYPEI